MSKLYSCDECKAEFTVGEHNDSGDFCISCHKEWIKQSALAAGIPLSVIEGKTKLTDHFSSEYIDFKRNKLAE